MINLNSRILLVDDFQTVRVMLRSVLKDLGYKNIEEAEDGKQALLLLADGFEEQRPFSLVFSDINMPELDGLELLQLVRADPRFKKLPFIMVTAEADRDQVNKAVQEGVTGYIIKPFSPLTIKTKLEELTGR